MKRPDQHITETKSQRIFENIVPTEWVCREIKPDYGVDYLVEIFENNESTGKTFFVQLKGSTQKIEHDIFEKQITTDNLKYYNSLALPVIIICVSVETKQIWGIWANTLIHQNPLKENQKSISLLLNEDYLVDEARLILIASQLDVSNRLGISTEYDSDLAQMFNSHILQWIEHFYSDSVSVKFNNLPKHLKLIHTHSNGVVHTSISTHSGSKSIEIHGLSEELPFLHRPIFDVESINDFNKDVLLNIAISLAKYDVKGTLELLIRLIDKIDLTNQKRWMELDPLGMLILAKEQNEIHLYNKLVREIIKSEQYELQLFFDLSYFIEGSLELEEYRIENLKTVIASTSNKQVQGTCHYNIGNILRRGKGNSLNHYINAVKLYPDYKKREYWWKEIAGLFFIEKHYKWAEICYNKSLELSDIPNEVKFLRLEKKSRKEEYLVNALIGDCLFLQGKFTESNSHFEKYLNLNKYASEEWVLKNIVCLELMGGKLDNIKFNQKKSIQLCEKGLTIYDNPKLITILNEAIEFHPTNGLAWFNLGVALDKEAKFDEALFAFLITGLIQDGDKEAQFNALIISFDMGDYKIMQALLFYITEKHGDSIINDLSDYLMLKNMPLEVKKKMIEMFNKMLEEIKTMHNMRYI